MKKSWILSLILVLSGCSMSGTNVAAPVANGSIWKSMDAGKTWEATKSTDKVNLAGLDILSIAFNPYDTRNVFAGLRQGGILKTEDGGATWSFMNFQSEKVYGLAVETSNGKNLYASGVWQKRGKIFKSEDLGVNWNEIYSAPAVGPLVISLTLDKKNPSTLYATTSDNAVLKTDNGGATWKNIFDAPAPVMQVAIDASNSNLVYYEIQNRGIWRSRSGGTNPEDLTKKMTSKKFSSIAVSLVNTDTAGVVYAAGEAGILKSSDGGETWSKIETLADPKNFPVSALAVSPTDPKTIVYGAGQTIYKSVDGGANWTTFQMEVGQKINILKFDPADGNTVYLGLSK